MLNFPHEQVSGTGVVTVLMGLPVFVSYHNGIPNYRVDSAL